MCELCPHSIERELCQHSIEKFARNFYVHSSSVFYICVHVPIQMLESRKIVRGQMVNPNVPLPFLAFQVLLGSANGGGLHAVVHPS